MYPMFFSPSFCFVLRRVFFPDPLPSLLIMCGGVGLAGLMLMQVLSLRDVTRTQDNGPVLRLTGYVLMNLLKYYRFLTQRSEGGNLFPKNRKLPPIPPTIPHSPGCLLP